MDKVFQIIASETFIACLSCLLGAFLGWALNEYSTSRRAKPKLCFHIVGTSVDERTEKEGRTNYDASDYSVAVYNVGQTPFVLESFNIIHKREILIDCHITGRCKTVLPYNSMAYALNVEEFDALVHHCGRMKLKHCTVNAYDVEGNLYETELDVSWLSLQAEFSAEDMIVAQ